MELVTLEEGYSNSLICCEQRKTLELLASSIPKTCNVNAMAIALGYSLELDDSTILLKTPQT